MLPQTKVSQFKISTTINRLGTRSVWKKYTLLLLGQGFFYYFYTRQSFPVSRGTIPLHTLVIIALVAFLSLIICLIPIQSGLRRIVAIISGTTVQLALLTTYTLLFFGYKYIGGPIDLRMALGYLNNPMPIIASSGFKTEYFIFAIFSIVVFSAFVNIWIFSEVNRAKSSLIAIFTIPCILVIYFATRQIWITREPLHIFSYAQETTAAPNGLIKFDKPRLKPEYTEVRSNRKLIYRPLVLITVDALRSDSMQVYGNNTRNTPYLTELFRTGKLRRIENTKSICTVSYCGLVGLLASRYWGQLNQTPDNLPDVLYSNGYKSYFLLSGDHTNFWGLRRQYGENIEVYKDGSTQTSSDPNDDQQIFQWLNTLSIKDPSRSFLYIHLMSAHQGGLRLSKYHVDIKKTSIDDIIIDGLSIFEHRQKYNDGILQADDNIKLIFEWLAKNKWLKNALVIITADHGEMQGEFNKVHHGGLPFEPVINIPLLIYDPIAKKYPKRNITSQTDIAPTFLHAINADIPNRWSGIPLQMKTTRCAVAINSHNAKGLAGVVDGQYIKVINIERDPRNPYFYNLNDNEFSGSAYIKSTLKKKLESCFNNQ